MSQTSVVYRTLVLIAVDLLAVVSAVGSAYFLRFLSGLFPYEEFHTLRNYSGYLLILLVASIAVLAANGLYRPRRAISWVDHFYAIFTSLSVAHAIAMVSTTVMWPDASSSRLMVAMSWLLTILFVTIGRYVVHRVQIALRSRGIDVERLLIVGTGEPGHLVLDRVQ